MYIKKEVRIQSSTEKRVPDELIFSLVLNFLYLYKLVVCIFLHNV